MRDLLVILLIIPLLVRTLILVEQFILIKLLKDIVLHQFHLHLEIANFKIISLRQENLLAALFSLNFLMNT